ncbi:MAG: DNA polymerase III subunit alpha [Patescibacteria group bacterium UBA2103]
MSNYVQINTHSHYSFLRALPKIKELVAEAKKHELPAIALTDAGNLHGAIAFYKECEKQEIKPILGVHTYVAPGNRTDPHDREHDLARIILLAKNEKGYKNLLAIVSDSYLTGFWERPRVDLELLTNHSEGVIAILPAYQSETSNLLLQNDIEGASALLATYKDIYKDDLYLEITDHPENKDRKALNEKIVTLSEKENVPLVANQEVYYIKPEDKEAREVLMRIREGRHAKAAGNLDLSFKKPKDIEKAFKDLPEAIENSKKIADKIDLSFDLGKWVFPDIEVPSGLEYQDELRRLAFEGIKNRGLEETKEVVDRLNYELDIIEQKKFAPYFLIVADLLRFARENKILTTIRGSVAGSLTTYVLGITNVDPLEYRLPFERFLNPERPSAPDIDMDFADNRRDEVINYAREKYGEDHVAQIGTFGTMAARAAVRDTARALGHAYMVGDKIAKLIPMGSQGFPMTIERALQIEPDLKKLYKGDEDAKEIIDLAKKVEGCARQTGVHAAGVVISPSPLHEWTPIQHDPKGGKLITQYDMHAVEDAGLIKFDFLGIKNLAILADAVARAKEETGDEIDIENVPVDDPITFKLLASGQTEGLFQLNGSGMTRFLKELKPTNINDINAMVALYRPGPMDSIPEYIERKHNPKKVSYMHEKMKDILEASHGVITYQDDVLLIAINIAGYSWLEADKLRKAMGKKIPEEMEKQKEKFLQGCVDNGTDLAKANQIWDLIAPFAGYGFNKAHAASYGRVAYQTAYMKANYPVPYMAALLTADAGDTEKISILIAECERMGIPVLPPDINESNSDFTIVENNTKIRFGLVSIKNFGAGVAEAIIKEREENGKFTNIADFLSRVTSSALNRKGLESLIKSGALDSLGTRGEFLKNIDQLITFHKEAGHEKGSQDSLFGELMPTHRLDLAPAEDAPLKEKLVWEKELLGIYVSGHPLDEFEEKLKTVKRNIHHILHGPKSGLPIVIAGMIEEAKPFLTKKGDRMAFVKIQDKSGSIECVVFPKVYEQSAEIIYPSSCVVLKGSLSGRNGETSIIIDKLQSL